MSLLYKSAQVKILSTVEYEQFSFDETNRPIDSNHVESLYDAIEEKNLLHLFPGIVTSEGVIRDGQHRFLAAQALEVPYYFIISDEMKEGDVPLATSLVSHWTMEDYLHHYVKRGVQDYILLQEFLEAYPFIKISTAYFMANYSGWGDLLKDYKNGAWVADDLPWARAVAQHVLDFKEAQVDFWSNQLFIRSLAHAMGIDGYDPALMREKLTYLSGKLIKAPDMDGYLETLNFVYNYRNRTNSLDIRKRHPSDKDFRSERKRQAQREKQQKEQKLHQEKSLQQRLKKKQKLQAA